MLKISPAALTDSKNRILTKIIIGFGFFRAAGAKKSYFSGLKCGFLMVKARRRREKIVFLESKMRISKGKSAPQARKNRVFRDLNVDF